MREFRYTDCGLENVVIEGLESQIDDAGEEVVVIPNIFGLHKVLAYCIITRPHGLRPDELKFLRTEMGLTQAELAERQTTCTMTAGTVGLGYPMAYCMGKASPTCYRWRDWAGGTQTLAQDLIPRETHAPTGRIETLCREHVPCGLAHNQSPYR